MMELEKAKQYLVDKGIMKADVGVVLGTGLHHLINLIEVTHTIPYADIPYFPLSTVEFHKGNLIYGKIGTKKILIMQGRFHAYEGYSMQQVVFPIRVMKLLGIEFLLLSNAAGGINPSFKKGNLVLINDHINRYLKIIGADLVGMSTVPEVIAANHMQLPCAAISVITDECDPDNLKPVNIAEIIAVAGKADKKLSELFYKTITAL